jgi:hypothetical protein
MHRQGPDGPLFLSEDAIHQRRVLEYPPPPGWDGQRVEVNDFLVECLAMSPPAHQREARRSVQLGASRGSRDTYFFIIIILSKFTAHSAWAGALFVVIRRLSSRKSNSQFNEEGVSEIGR